MPVLEGDFDIRPDDTLDTLSVACALASLAVLQAEADGYVGVPCGVHRDAMEGRCYRAKKLKVPEPDAGDLRTAVNVLAYGVLTFDSAEAREDFVYILTEDALPKVLRRMEMAVTIDPVTE